MSDLPAPREEVLEGEALHPDQPGFHVTLTAKEAWALWEWSQSSDAAHYWEIRGLSAIIAELKQWIISDAPW